MGRPPSGMEVMKKGHWTPEEDLMLASYIQEKGPGNWSSVPKNTGLERCSKSCRLRWLNHLRPGLKRRNFTAEEDRKIIHLQAVLGNKWASIARHLPERTDNDVKNYWNAHLKKNADRAHGSCSDDDQRHAGSGSNTTTGAPDHDSDFSEGCWENSHSPPASAAHPTATLPLTAPGQRSPLAVAIAPLLSSGCMSFKPPHGWNLNARQQLMIPENDQFRSPAPITRASNHSTEPYVFNCENIVLWLQRWNKETHMSKLDDVESALTKKKDDFNGSGAAAERICSL